MKDAPAAPRTVGAFLRSELRPLNALLVAVPVAAGLELAHAGGQWVFLASGLAIVPLAGLMGRATESLADAFGPGVGGLLNATLGNAAELIIALFALARGPDLYPLVKASLTGSIIGNVLLVLGLSILAGGLRHKRQTFNAAAAGMGTTLLALASIGLLVPTLYFHIAGRGAGAHELDSLSEEIAVVLAVVYVLSLVFTLGTHRHLFAGPEGDPGAAPAGHAPEWSRGVAFAVLLAATAGVALMSEFLVGSVTDAAAALGWGKLFVGVVVVAVIGNAAEHSTAVLAALKDKMDLAVTIAVGSSIQVALFVAPVLVFASLLVNRGQPLDLHFSLMEVVAVIAAVGVLALVSQDGESHWMEGAMMLAVYAVFALAFYHLPHAPPV
jgi:Ca2+:H+ antiporter